MFQSLAKADAGVDPHARGINTRLTRSAGTQTQELQHLGHNIGVARRDLHGAWFALHVHRDVTRIRLGDNLQHVGVTKSGGHIVHHAGTRPQGGKGRFRMARVDRQRGIDTARQRLDQRHYARDLVARRHGLGSRSRGFPTNVQPLRTSSHHGEPALEQLLIAGAAIGKAIGRGIEHAHYARSRCRRVRHRIAQVEQFQPRMRARSQAQHIAWHAPRDHVAGRSRMQSTIHPEVLRQFRALRCIHADDCVPRMARTYKRARTQGPRAFGQERRQAHAGDRPALPKPSVDSVPASVRPSRNGRNGGGGGVAGGSGRTTSSPAIKRLISSPVMVS